MDAKLEIIQPPRLPKIEEVILKKKNVIREKRKDKVEKLREEKIKHVKIKKYFRRYTADDILKECVSRTNDLKRFYKVARRPLDYYDVNDKYKFLLVVRNGKTTNFCSKPTSLLLDRLQLSNKNAALILPNNAIVIRKLECLRYFLFYGYIEKDLLRSLFLKYGKINTIENEKVLMSDNRVIEQALEGTGVLCLEDIVHEAYNATPIYQSICSAILPFTLPPAPYHDYINSKFKTVCGNIENQMQEAVKRFI